MRKLVLLFLLLNGVFHQLQAQITVSNTVFPVVGDTLHYAFGNQAGAINQIFTPPGGVQQWDLSNLQATQYWNPVMQDPSTGADHAFFQGATILYNPPNSSSEAYLQVTGNQVLGMGYAGLDKLGLGLDILFQNKPSLEVSWAPVNFFDIHQSAANVLTAFDAPIAPPVLLNLVPAADSFRIRVTYQRIASIDAYGTMTIPGGTFDVLRKKQTEYKSTAVDVKVAPLGWIDISTIGGQQLLPLGTDTITTFHFLNDVSKEEIAICTLNTGQNTVTGVQYKAVNVPSRVNAALLDRGVLIYPNPAHDMVYVHFNRQTGAELQFELLDIRGQVILRQNGQLVPGESDIHISVSSLPLGLYQLLVRENGNLLIGKRLVKI